MKKAKKVILGISLISLLILSIIKIDFKSTADTVADTSNEPSVSYQTYLQDKKWMASVSDGNISGTTGQSLRVEAIKMKLKNLPSGQSGGISYSTYIQGTGWQSYVKDDALAGTTGKSLCVEAFKVKLTGEIANHYSVYYSAHVQGIGWQPYVKDDALAGTTGKSLRVEAIKVKLVKKASSVDASPIEIQNEIEEGLDPTQRWLNSVSDSLEKQGYIVLGGTQTVENGLSIQARKELTDGYYVLNEVNISPDGNDLDSKSAIYKDNKVYAIQEATGSITIVGEKVQYDYEDMQTKEKGTIDLSAGHTSAAAAVFTYTAVAELSGGASLTTLSLAAAPVVFPTIVLGGLGYIAYTSVKEDRELQAAGASRIMQSAQLISSDFSSLTNALSVGDISLANSFRNRISTAESIHNTNVSHLSNLNINVAKFEPIHVDIPPIDIDSIKNNIDSLTNTADGLLASLKSINQSIQEWTVSVNKLSEILDKMFADIPLISAPPVLSSVSYDSQKKVMNIIGSMSKASTITIYLNPESEHAPTETKTFSTNEAGQFNISFSVSKGIVSIDAKENPTNKETESAFRGPIYYHDFPHIFVSPEGTLSFNSTAKEIYSKASPIKKASESPVFSSIKYDNNTKSLNITGKMPSSSTIKVWQGAFSKTPTSYRTNDDGNFSINFSVSSLSASIYLEATQDSTSNIFYEPNTYFEAGFFTSAPDRLDIQSDGTLTAYSDMYLGLNNIKTIELAPKPTLNTAKYDEKKGTIEISGTIASPVMVEIYQADTFSTKEANFKLIKTEKITSPGNFNLSITATTGVIYTRFVKEATDKIYYFNDYARTSPGFKIEDDKTISTSEYTSVLTSGQTKTNKQSEKATIKNISYNKENKELTVSGTTEAGALISICSPSYSTNKTYGTLRADGNGNFNGTVSVGNGEILIYTLYNSTDSVIYSTSRYSLFEITDNGRLVAPYPSENETLSNPLPVVKESALPKISEINYDKDTNLFHISGTLPAGTNITIDQWSYFSNDLTRIGEFTTDEMGNFNISQPIIPSLVKVLINQKPTKEIEYLTKTVSFDIVENGKIISYSNNWTTGLGIQTYSSTDLKMASSPTQDVENNLIYFPIQVDGIADVKVYNNNNLISEQKTNASGFINLAVSIHSGEDNGIKIVVQREETSETFYRTLEGDFVYDKNGSILATKTTNSRFKTTLPICPEIRKSTPPRFSEITYDETKKSLNISGKIKYKGQVSAYINKIKTVSVNTKDDGTFSVEIPINSSNVETYTSSLTSFDSPMFTVDSSKGLQICGEAEPLIDLKKLITPIPKVEPFTVGDGIIIEGATLPFSEILIKKNGIEYKGTADDKGIFKISLNEITLSDVLEIIAKAPGGTTSSYDASESSSMSPAKTISEAESEAIESQLDNMIENKINHIMQEHHDWEKVVDSVSWESIKPLIKEVMEKGITKPHGKNPEDGIFRKEAKIGTETIGVTFRIIDGVPIISDAWVVK